MSRLFSLAIVLEAAIVVSSDTTSDEIPRFLIPSTTSCDPATDCKNATPGTLVPDPKDCYKYYVCVTSGGEVTNSDTSFSCPTGQYFNSTTEACINETTPCTSECGGSCSLTCSEPLQVVGFAGNCSKYYICTFGGGKVLAECPASTPYFDGTNCISNSASCCDFCSATCDEVGVQIPDPNDCHKYYVCVATGTPSEYLHATCGLGQIFDPNTGSCEQGTSCTPICSSSGGGESDKCPTSFNCTTDGNFPRCDFCDSSYFSCSAAGAEISTCPVDTVFNTNPDYPFCIRPEDCPYPS